MKTTHSTYAASRSVHAPAHPVQVRVFIVMSSLMILLAVMGAGV